MTFEGLDKNQQPPRMPEKLAMKFRLGYKDKPHEMDHLKDDLQQMHEYVDIK
jgi:hypothetical protein